MHESACWAVAVERWARIATRRRKGLFHPFVRYLTHLDLASAMSPRECGAASKLHVFQKIARRKVDELLDDTANGNHAYT